METTTKKRTKEKVNPRERAKESATKEKAAAATKAKERATKETTKEKEKASLIPTQEKAKDLQPKGQEMYSTNVAGLDTMLEPLEIAVSRYITSAKQMTTAMFKEMIGGMATMMNDGRTEIPNHLESSYNNSQLALPSTTANTRTESQQAVITDQIGTVKTAIMGMYQQEDDLLWPHANHGTLQAGQAMPTQASTTATEFFPRVERTTSWWAQEQLRMSVQRSRLRAPAPP